MARTISPAGRRSWSDTPVPAHTTRTSGRDDRLPIVRRAASRSAQSRPRHDPVVEPTTARRGLTPRSTGSAGTACASARRRHGQGGRLGRRSLGQPCGALPGARDHGLISVGSRRQLSCESRTEGHPEAFGQPVMQYSALVKLIRRALAALGLAAAIASALRLRGRGGTPPQHGGWQPIDLEQR